MPVDVSFYNQNPLRSVFDYQGQIDRNALSNQAVQQNALAFQDRARALQESNALRDLMRSGVDITTPEGSMKAAAVAPNVAPAMVKTLSQAGLERSQAGAAQANTAETNVKTQGLQWQQQIDKANNAVKEITSFNTPEDIVSSILKHSSSGELPIDRATSMLQNLPKNPQEFADWKQKMLMQTMTAKQQLDMQKPTIQVRNTGGSTDVLAIDPMTGQPTVTNSVPNTQSPESIAQAETARRGQNMQQQTAREGHQTQLTIAGIGPNGEIDQNMERTAQAVASGQLPPPTGIALLNPKNQRMLGRVMEINPEYDFSSVTAKKAAASAFTSGSQGNALRSISTANAHLDQLGTLVDALKNGNIQVINRVAQDYSAATGNPAPTTFDAVKNIIGQEVVKAIVAGGGTGGERDEAAKAFDRANSPTQLKEAIGHYRMVMGAQESNLLEQRRAAGLPDSTLPKYNKPSTAKASSVVDWSTLK
jgi:hypothetical protein